MSRILGLDPGERRIGVALSDPMGIIAQPHAVLDRRRRDLIAELGRIISEYEVVTVVVGLPVGLGGTEGAAAAGSRGLAAEIGEALGVAVEFQDERFTTVQAESALLEQGMRRSDRRERRDKVAAALMLQGYLDRRTAPEGPAANDTATKDTAASDDTEATDDTQAPDDTEGIGQ